MKARLFLAAVPILLLAACASQGDAVKTDLNDVKSYAFEMRGELNGVKTDVARLKRDDSVRDDALNALKTSQADLLGRVQSLDSDVKDLRGSVEEEKHFSEKAINDQSGASLGLKQQMGSMEQTLKAQEEALINQANRIGQLEQEIKTLTAAPKPAASQSAQEQYDQAYSLFEGGKYPDARAAFQGFLKNNPDNDLAGNAQFWLAETYFKQKDYETAVLAYDEVIKKYPQNRKVPSALLKQGLSFVEMKDPKVASALFKELIDKYPGSDEAQTAREKLAGLGPHAKSAKKAKSHRR